MDTVEYGKDEAGKEDDHDTWGLLKCMERF